MKHAANERTRTGAARLRGGGLTVFLVFCAFFLLSAAPLAAQSWNRAVFRGDEIDPRDFEFNDEYFLNIMSYSFAPDWEQDWQGSESFWPA